MNSNRKLRVGYVLKVFPRISETFVLNEILELERQGVEVEIFSLNPPSDPRFHSRLGRLQAKVHYLPRPDSSEMWRKLRGLVSSTELEASLTGQVFLRALEQTDGAGLKVFLQGLYLRAIAREKGINHLHAHFATVATRAAMTAHRLGGPTFSFTAHAKDIYQEERDKSLLPEALAEAEFAVTVTDFNVDNLGALTPNASEVVKRIYNGLPLDEIEFSTVPEQEVPCFAAVGRLVEKKGFDDLLEACALLRLRGVRFRGVIAGGGEQEAHLRALHSKLDLADCVEFVGPVAHDDALAIVRDSRAVVLPCIVGSDGNRDALPTSLLEALAIGRPAISTDLEGVTEIIEHERNGLLVPQRNPVAIADAIERLFTDPELCARMGRNGRAIVEERFDLSANVGEIVKLFDAVFEGHIESTVGVSPLSPAFNGAWGLEDENRVHIG